MAGGTCGQISCLVSAKSLLLVKLVLVTILADHLLTLHQLLRMVTAMAVMAEQTLACCYLRMRLVYGFAMILVAAIAGLRLAGGKHRSVGVLVERTVAISAAALDIGLVGKSKGVGIR